jgi:hypothetical protein
MNNMIVKGYAFKVRKDKVTEILSQCANPARLVQFLPTDYPVPVNSHIGNPYNFIKFMSNLMDMNVVDTSIPTYTWGDTFSENIGCDIQHFSPERNINLIRFVKKGL